MTIHDSPLTGDSSVLKETPSKSFRFIRGPVEPVKLSSKDSVSWPTDPGDPGSGLDGLDTVDANFTLGFRDDERSYDVAVAILKKLNLKKINLITNNPSKIQKLNEEGLKVLKVIKLKIKPNEINKNYINTKKNKSNHIFD